jgi:5-methylcytosine-specific restriction endonuclease McrA
MLTCERCGKEHYGIIGTGRFCSLRCAKQRMGNNNNKVRHIGVELLIPVICKNTLCAKKFSIGWSQDYCSLECFNTVMNRERECRYSQCKKIHNGQYGHGDFCSKSCARAFARQSWSLETTTKWIQAQTGRIDTEKQNYNNAHLLDGLAKFRLIKPYVLKEQNYKCALCGQGLLWQDKKLTLQCHHVDGISQNHVRTNLQMLCPNCHSQTNTYCSGNVKNTVLGRNVDIPKHLLDKSCIQFLSRVVNPEFKDIKSTYIRERILLECDYKCICGQSTMWNNKELTLQLHHIDGHTKNNSHENLVILCPNCHSQTDNYQDRYK